MVLLTPKLFSPKRFVSLLGIVACCAALPAQAQLPTELSFQAPPVGSPGNREAGSGRFVRRDPPPWSTLFYGVHCPCEGPMLRCTLPL
jgi:hypothetical protein